MAGSMERSQLYVEGHDDFHSIVHLLIRNGIDYDSKPWAESFPEIEAKGGKDAILESMRMASVVATCRTVGFVLDADSPLSARWQAVRSRIAKAQIEVPETPPLEGFIGRSKTYRTTVGVWLMPDNRRDGSLEDFLETLIDENDFLIAHAQIATDGAKQIGALFSDADQRKALLHAWLAWQETPGLPYGTAIRERYFQHESDTAKVFVDWFRRLYGIA